MRRIIAWSLLVVSVVGAAVTIPLWMAGELSPEQTDFMTNILSWAALWYAAFVAIEVDQK